MKSLKYFILFLVFFPSTLLLFQNCGQKKFESEKNNGVTQASSDACTFDGETIPSGRSITAFQNSNAAFGDECVSEKRTCDNGFLTGSFSFPSCEVNGPAACKFGDVILAHGESTTAFLNSTVPAGGVCQSESRKCYDGALSGSFQHDSCAVTPYLSCSFDGKTIPHLGSVRAFASSSVPFGETCQSVERVCNDGNLSGSGEFPSCNPGAPQSCSINGKTYAHGESVTFFKSSTAPFNANCEAEQRVCNNGQMSGSFAFNFCQVDGPKACRFNGKTYAHGESLKAFMTSSVPYGQGCKSYIRTCQNGELSGSGQFASCVVTQPKPCVVNGQTIAHNATVTLFSSANVPFGQSCQSTSRTCSNGVLSGSTNFIYGSCAPSTPAPCSLDGVTIAHGQQVTAYAAKSVRFGQSCSPVARTCNNGVLSGSGSYLSCAPDAPMNCSAGGVPVAHGQSAVFYSAPSVPFGQNCAAEARSCYNSTLSGSYSFGSCAPQAPASCTFKGKVYAHGESVKMFFDNEVAYNKSCKSEVRVCNNGQMSGSAKYKECDKEDPKNCKLADGNILKHGKSETFYKTCGQSKTRSCENGKLKGGDSSYEFAHCSMKTSGGGSDGYMYGPQASTNCNNPDSDGVCRRSSETHCSCDYDF